MKKEIQKLLDSGHTINDIKEVLHELSEFKDNPVDRVIWVDLDKVHSNDYNPNKVAQNEMKLLLNSIENDGYTQPVVTVYDKKQDRYIIVDGFHRYSVMKYNKALREKNKNKLPIVVIDSDIQGRMASTVRHNRARGKHSIFGMSNLVYKMLSEGVSEADICKNLGMEAEELLKIKHTTGYSYLYKDYKYNKGWVTVKELTAAKTKGNFNPKE